MFCQGGALAHYKNSILVFSCFFICFQSKFCIKVFFKVQKHLYLDIQSRNAEKKRLWKVKNVRLNLAIFRTIILLSIINWLYKVYLHFFFYFLFPFHVFCLFLLISRSNFIINTYSESLIDAEQNLIGLISISDRFSFNLSKLQNWKQAFS
jgi:Na+/glutamate symporter